MSFQLHPDANEWFKKVKGAAPFETLFDVYQLCCTLGLAQNRFEPFDSNGHEIMKDFIQRYRPFQVLIIGSMLQKSLDRQGVAISDRSTVTTEIGKFVSRTGNGLTSEGFRQLNGYAAGGFNCLREELEEPPSDIVFLLDRFHSLLSQSF